MELPDIATSKKAAPKITKRKHSEWVETSTSENSCTRTNLRASWDRMVALREGRASIASTGSSNNEAA